MGNGLFKTTDGGVTWSEIGDLYSIALFYAIDPEHGWLVQRDWFLESGDKISRTSNGGSTWEILDNGRKPNLNSVFFTNGQKGWAVGGGLNSSSQMDGVILHTTNGGNIWQTTTYGRSFLTDVTFKGTQSGWIVGDTGTILKTSDAGASWQPQISGTQAYLKAVHFVTDQEGWVAGDQGIILHTTNGGHTWQLQASDATAWLQDVFFTDNQHGWIVGSKNLYTTDGGITWQTSGLTTTGGFVSIFFRNNQIGWATGADARVYKTIDGGLNWYVVNHEPPSDQASIQFQDDQNGWTVGNGMFHTSDGGETWSGVSSVAWIWLNRVFFLNNQEGWIVGQNGAILHTTTGGLPVANKTLVSSPTFSLYPNPAENHITLQTSSPIQSIHISDALGRTVGAENFLHLPAAATNNHLNISSLTPGIYTLRIQTSEGTAVQRAVKK